MSGENSYFSRFFVKFVEVSAAGLATAISAAKRGADRRGQLPDRRHRQRQGGQDGVRDEMVAHRSEQIHPPASYVGQANQHAPGSSRS